VQRIIEQAGIPTIIISALPPVTRQNGAPRAVAPLVPMGANAGAPHDKAMQTAILKEALEHLIKIEAAGTHVPLPYQYTAQV
jgi:D-proline reductase (dithiol) PrdB